MKRRALRFGPISVGGATVQRSGLRWLVPDGHRCSAGERIAYCNVGVQFHGPAGRRPNPFADETRDLQIVFVVAAPGVLHLRSGVSLGGDLDKFHFFQAWDPAEILADLETDAETPELLLQGVAGRRFSELAEDRSRLLSGWHSRARAWHAEIGGHFSILSLGICEQNGIFRGEDNAFAELLAAGPAPLHTIHVSDEALVPCAATLIEQYRRDPAQTARIAENVARGVAGNEVTPTAADLLFAGFAMTALARDPLAERYNLLTRTGVFSAGVDALILSIHAEPGVILRHKRFGYHAFWHRFRLAAAGPATREWIQTEFDTVRRTRDDVKRDLIALQRTAAGAGIRHVLILNAMSSSGHEDIVSYRPFEGALSDQLGTIAAKETNLMLHDLVEAADIALIDLDAIAASVGGAANLPDSVHQSRRMQDEFRQEILHVLRNRGAFDHAADAIAEPTLV